MAAAAEIVTIDRARAHAICAKIRQSMTSARDLLLELYEGRGWEALGYKSWRECATAEFGEHQRTLYKQLEAAKVARELDASQDGLSVGEFGNKSTPANAISVSVPDSQLVALAKAPEGTRAEVLEVATGAAGGCPTAEIVRAAVEAKNADPEASAEQLVEAVRAAVAVKAEPTSRVAEEEVAKPVAAEPDAADEDGEAPEEVIQAVREEHAEAAAKRDELTDDEWLAGLPLTSKLQGHALDKFRRDALYYRRFEPIRRELARFHSKAKKEVFRGASGQGYVSFTVGSLLSVEHPKDWRVCPPIESGGCDGTGTPGIIGQCPTCYGRGYLAR